jgi:tetratricopeptide (TPR) repeat protein
MERTGIVGASWYDYCWFARPSLYVHLNQGERMMNRGMAFMCSIFIVAAMSSCSTTEEVARELAGFESFSGPYFGQESPGTEPKLFMPGLVATTDNDRCVTFLDNGNLVIFTRDLEGVRYAFVENGKWTTPVSGPLDFEYYSKYSEFDFTAAPDGQAIYFQTGRPTGPDDTEHEWNIWIVEWTGTSWGEPRPLPSPVNTENHHEAYPSVGSSGTIYFFSGKREEHQSYDIYRSRFVDGAYLPHEHLDWPINTVYDELDPYVVPDEGYLLFGSRRPGGFGRCDTYISFRAEDGSWTHPLNLGHPFNSTSWENRVNVTPDGKYFFFASTRVTDVPKGDPLSNPIGEIYGDSDIYWAETRFIDDLKTRVLSQQCAGDVLRDEYGERGLQPAVNMLVDLSTNKKEDYFFPLYELLAICADMIQAGKREDADQFYDALRNSFPDDYRIRLGYAAICTMNGLVDKGLTLYKEALADNPSELRWEVHLRASDLLLFSKDEDALKALHFNVEEFPDWPLAYTRLAGFYEQRGDKDNALVNCKKALELKPDDKAAKAMLERLE